MLWQVMLTDFPIDMIVYRQGVRAFINGTPLYAEPMVVSPDIVLPFIYPPFGALVMVPLTAPAWLSDDGAGNIVIIASSLALLWSLGALSRALAPQVRAASRWAVVLAVWAVMVSIEPVRLNNGFAQINMLLMAMVFADLVPRRRRLPQGWLIGLAAAIKLTPAAMVLYFLLRRDFRALATAAGTGLAATALAAVVRPDATAEFFSEKLVTMGSGGSFGVNTSYQSNSSIRGALQRAFSSQEALDAASSWVFLCWAVAALAVVLGGAWLMRAALRRGLLVDAVLLNALIMLLISPVSWSHHWVWLSLLLPLSGYRAIRWSISSRDWAPRALGAVVLAWTVLVLVVPPKWWFGDAIDVFALSAWEKFLVSDFLWLSAAWLLAYIPAMLRQPLRPASSSADLPA